MATPVHALLDAAFPFHVVVGEDMVIRRVGRSIARLCPGITVGDPLGDHLCPTRDVDLLAHLQDHEGGSLILQALESGARLRTQLHALDREIALLMTPWVSGPEIMHRLGLGPGDFAGFDPTADYAFQQQQQALAVADSQRVIAKLKEMERRRRHEADLDALTGMPNRGRLQRALDAAPGGSALLLLEIDRFKAVNDAHGNSVGDEVLRTVGARLREGVPAGALAARTGGNEFAVLLPESTPTDHLRTVEKVISEAGSPLQLGDVRLHITFSAGLSAFAAPTLYRDADVAMFAAKRSGGNRLVVFDPTQHSSLVHRTALQERLVAALQQGRISVMYQPLVRLSDDRLVGFEALARWTDDELGPIPPDTFVLIAEELGIVGDLDRHVLALAVAAYGEWTAKVPGAPLRMSVNLSPRALDEPTLVEHVWNLLAEARMPASDLQLEITESAIASPGSLDALHALRDMDVRLAIDDFGSAESTIARLHELPVNTLKIDKAMLRGWSDSGDRVMRLMRAVLAIAEALDLDTVAEGVETPEQVDAIREAGCTYGQGYHWSPPMSPEQAFTYFSNRAGLVPAPRRPRALRRGP